ncbi:MAG TPA: BamA/TamA family outer membrane protein [Gemmatimonadales bacterium]|nr:BamA/TamA family outer membrane protein [Gemmatimonadales bacterium]
MPSGRTWCAVGTLLLLSAAAVIRPLAAQDSVVVINPDAPPDDSSQVGIPPTILAELLTTWGDSSTIRLTGGLTLPAGAMLSGHVASFRGQVRIAGEVRGPLTVINGDLVLLPGGRVLGDVLVAGGLFTVEPGGIHEGNQRVFWDAAPLQRLSDGSLAIRERRRPLGDLAAERTFPIGQIRTTLRLTTTQTYNRIEGLGIVFGPAFEWRPSPRTSGTLDLRGILRTAPDPSPFRRDIGWVVRNDWRFHGSRGFGFGIRTYSVIAGVEEHTLPKDEIGWNAVLFQRDNRDYFSSEGVAGGIYNYFTRRLRVDLSARYEKQGSVRANDPWSLFRNDAWRPNPLIDDGHYTTLGVSAQYDGRNSPSAPTSGWWIRASVDHSSSDDVAPVSLPTSIRNRIPTSGYEFNRYTLDLRRYNRLSREANLNLRLWSAGWLSGDPLPLQRRLSLGGPDLLPGYGFRSLSCAPDFGFTDPARPALCDRALITQAEFRHRLSLRAGYTVRDAERRDLDRFIGVEDPELVLFGNAGSAWLAGDGPGRVPSDRIRSLDEWKADVGVGIDAGGIAAYVTKALTDNEPVRFYLRLERRF